MIINDPAFDYDSFGHDYSKHRKADPRIEKYIIHALKDCRSVINVGAGAGIKKLSQSQILKLW